MLRLPLEEQQLCAPWAKKRQATFVAGRLALREALVAAGVVASVDDVGVIDRDDRGAPVLPPLPRSVRVSVTHKDSVAAAVVLVVDDRNNDELNDDDVSIGIDLELDDGRDRKSTDRLAAQVLLPHELLTLDDDDDRRRRQLFERFSLKEALYKAFDPIVRRYVGFLEVAVVGAGDVVELALPTDPAFAGMRARGRVIHDDDADSFGDDVVLTLVQVRQSRRR